MYDLNINPFIFGPFQTQLWHIWFMTLARKFYAWCQCFYIFITIFSSTFQNLMLCKNQAFMQAQHNSKLLKCDGQFEEKVIGNEMRIYTHIYSFWKKFCFRINVCNECSILSFKKKNTRSILWQGMIKYAFWRWKLSSIQFINVNKSEMKFEYAFSTLFEWKTQWK